MSRKRNNHHRRSRNKKGRRSYSGRGRPGFNPKVFINKISAEDPAEYQAENRFRDLDLDKRLRKNIAAKGYEIPTPIQDRAIPPLLNGRDVVGAAATGTGKTGAFLIPLVNKVVRERDQRVLIVVPTRELALQVESELRGFSRGLEIDSVVCIGGASIKRQIGKLKNKPEFVVGTPGRLLDLSRRKKINFADFNNLVLDEVDRMLDMGFIKDITFIASGLPKKRQSLFFSATLPKKVNSVIKRFTNNPVEIKIEARAPSNRVNQDVVRIRGRSKIEVLFGLLKNRELEKVLVFGRTKRGVDKLGRKLTKKGMGVATIHGGRSQHQRRKALDRFRRDKVQVLLATDVASRGLDIDNITHVINYDLPQTYDDYIHRIGRTGRAGGIGFALTFVE